MNKHLYVNGNTDFTNNKEHTSNIRQAITRHNHNNYERNVIKHVDNHIAHSSSSDTEITCYNNISFNTKETNKQVIVTFTMIVLSLEIMN